MAGQRCGGLTELDAVKSHSRRRRSEILELFAKEIPIYQELYQDARRPRARRYE
jgi:hypothetical protein